MHWRDSDGIREHSQHASAMYRGFRDLKTLLALNYWKDSEALPKLDLKSQRLARFEHFPSGPARTARGPCIGIQKASLAGSGALANCFPHVQKHHQVR